MGDEDDDLALIDATGVGGQVKVGKEWWVSGKWGLGVSAFYHFGHVGNGDISDAPFEKMSSHACGLCFNATLN